MPRTKAIYPGSFDPITLGHLDVLQRACRLFDEVIVAVAVHTPKAPLLSLAERVELIEQVIHHHFGDVHPRVIPFDGLTVDFARSQGACAIVRGLRALSDFEFEFQLALTNRKLDSSIETVFLMPKESYSYLSSSLVKEICRLGGSIAAFVPPEVEAKLIARLRPSSSHASSSQNSQERE
ncbi:pantetheine-phosphate adenylyltransferase [Candidatus Methylacidithermus pantelleriae]|uniref:Phosphopantetheine adenylyltransferase n=1 Tax=Candidatus Methylacidithermus pantelleriae TaxID=2744239 RepID=A0A8J2BGD8_9BACT|nr:pantetheine-phosphate adenylyltransferase [Candidatus Methylacidithermus pantelleriae]CAF0691354.1 Phosphopantetheine adenylyltransferase [Candidatus Methylacidithermus pantelleriae]